MLTRHGVARRDTPEGAAGHRVIRFDHRDTGLSVKMHGMRAEGSVYRRAWRDLLGRTSPPRPAQPARFGNDLHNLAHCCDEFQQPPRGRQA